MKPIDPLKILFVCTYNMMRSVTAEHLFKNDPSLQVKSAGTHPAAAVRVDADLLNWANIIFVMEDIHKSIIDKMLNSNHLSRKTVCLDISDDYGYMDQDLMDILNRRIQTYLDDYFSSERTSDPESRC